MKLIFIRHGDPIYETDSLTEQGIREAKLLAPRIPTLGGDEFYVSPLGRAQETAKYALEGTGIVPKTLWWLEEFSTVVYRPDKPETGGIAWDWRPEDWTGIDDLYNVDRWYKLPVFEQAGIEEKHRAVIECFDAFLEQHGYVREGRMYKAVAPTNDTLVFFCHFGLQALLTAHLFSISPMILWQGYIAAPTAVTTIVTEERTEGNAAFRCISFGDTSHLYVAGEKPGWSGRFCECFANENERHD
ncbi:MAG: histidine phosphatase family protein [Lachnospiraceae bacterium]|nr:histidine phosphatase family protein [Lachnospiraceae bacterium]